MTFRTRILLACIAAALVPLVVLAAGARHVIGDRLTEQFGARVAASGDALRRALTIRAQETDARLLTVARRLTGEPTLRAALLDAGDRAALLDFAGDAMAPAGLDYLLLIDDSGVVLSSGHFRNDYGRELAGLPALQRADGPVLVEARTPAGGFLALVRTTTLELGGRRFTLAGGSAIDSAFVARLSGPADEAVTVALTAPGHAPIGAARFDREQEAVTEYVVLPFIRADGTAGEARWRITHGLEPLHALTRALDRWFLAAFAAALVLAFIIARVLAARVTRPLEELARRARHVELARYDVQLATTRQDEVGSLSRLLDRMVQRLRAGAQQLREAERRATVGDMARQVNHDIRNGLLPIRNVIQHLAEVAQDTPAELRTVFAEREGTLRSGIGYLESLAANYARLTPRIEREMCDVNILLERVLRESSAGGDPRVTLRIGADLPRVSADPVALRRVVENLVLNALESLGEKDGSVVVRSSVAGGPDDRTVSVAVEDNGTGITPEDMERIFDDFHTTRERGSGLGLSIVRRLVADMGGRIRVHSEVGRGTTFTIELRAAA